MQGYYDKSQASDLDDLVWRVSRPKEEKIFIYWGAEDITVNPDDDDEQVLLKFRWSAERQNTSVEALMKTKPRSRRKHA